MIFDLQKKTKPTARTTMDCCAATNYRKKNWYFIGCIVSQSGKRPQFFLLRLITPGSSDFCTLWLKSQQLVLLCCNNDCCCVRRYSALDDARAHGGTLWQERRVYSTRIIHTCLEKEQRFRTVCAILAGIFLTHHQQWRTTATIKPTRDSWRPFGFWHKQ